MKNGREKVAPQYRDRAGISESKPESRKGQALPKSNVDEPDVTKAAYPQPVSKSRRG